VRVLIVNKFWKPVGGVEIHAFTLQAELEALGHEVVPFSMQDPENEPTPYERYFVTPVDFRDESPTRRVRAVARATLGVQTVQRLRRLLDAEQIDVAHVLHPYHQLGTTFLPVLRARGIPIVLGLHDYKIGCASYRLFSDATGTMCTRCIDGGALTKYWAPIAERCWSGSRAAGASLVAETVVSRGLGMYRRNVDLVLVLNELQRRCALQAGFRDDQVRFLPHFVDMGSAAPSVDRGEHALYVGRLVPEKGVDVLLRAAAAGGTPLRVVGDGRSRAELEALARELDADVTFLGSLSTDEVGKEMDAAAALVVPSVWHEVSPLVIFEAFAHGLPVIGTAVGGVVDLLGDGRGMLVPPADVPALTSVLQRMATEPEAFRQAAAIAQDHAVRELSRDRFRERLLRAYADAGARGGGRR